MIQQLLVGRIYKCQVSPKDQRHHSKYQQIGKHHTELQHRTPKYQQESNQAKMCTSIPQSCQRCNTMTGVRWLGDCPAMLGYHCPDHKMGQWELDPNTANGCRFCRHV